MRCSITKLVLAGCVCLMTLTLSGRAETELEKLVSEGKSYLKNGQMNEALLAFREAAKTGSMEGSTLAGEILLVRAQQSSGRESLMNASEGINLLFFAATNRYAQACFDLSIAYRLGIGVKTNVVTAYAWLKIAAEQNRLLKTDLDRLVVTLDRREITMAQELAAEFNRGQWPQFAFKPIVLDDSRLKIQGVTHTSKGALVVVNGITFASGDSGDVSPINAAKQRNAEKLGVTCLEIGKDYILVAIAGEPNYKLLNLRQFLQD